MDRRQSTVCASLARYLNMSLYSRQAVMPAGQNLPGFLAETAIVIMVV